MSSYTGTIFATKGSARARSPLPRLLRIDMTKRTPLALASAPTEAHQNRPTSGSLGRAAIATLLLMAGGSSAVDAATLTTLVSFNGSNGEVPSNGSLFADAAGNLFGTTQMGGAFSGFGTVFEIAKTGSGYSAPTTLVSFNSSNGGDPNSNLIADAAGNLFGTTVAGGPYNSGTVFEIAKSGSGYGVPTTLATFTGSNGASPFAGLIADAAGNLFGTTGRGGASGDGTVFEIAKTGSGYSAPTTLATFTASPGVYPYGGLIADTAGNLFGTTEEGGAYNAGTVFEIAKS